MVAQTRQSLQRIQRRRWRLVLGAIVVLATGVARAESPFAAAIGVVQPKIVKIYGAGGVSGLESYQSGFLISAEGHVLTVWSYVLDTDYLAVTLNDGRKFEGKLIGANPALELAVLKIEPQGPLPFFDLSHSPIADVGSRVLAFSNLFGVAMGEEAASVQHGVVAAKTRLDARRGAFETPYHGAVYVIDAITNNPGAAGGALTNLHGELLGMLGKELRNSLNHTWLNYALPVDQLAASVDQIIAGKPRPGQTPLAKRDSDKHDPDRADGAPEDRALTAGAARLAALGVVLVPDVLERTPPFVDEVRPGSPAAESVRPDDLVVFVGERLVQSCKGLLEELARAEPDMDLKLVVMRGQELIEVSLKPGPEQASERAP